MSDWKTIESAPGCGENPHVRGVWVNIRDKDGDVLHHYWQADIGVVDENDNFIGSHDDDFGFPASEYTHWMPLPEPPKL